jgi:putative acetyltransferase
MISNESNIVHMPELRRATQGEEEKILELVKKVLAMYGLETDPSETDSDLSDLNKYYFENNGWFAVIEYHGEIIGSYGLFQIDKNVCELRKMYLSPGHQGKGLGKMMMADFINKAKELGYSEVILETNTRLDKAIGLYEKYGFVGFEPPHLSARCDYGMRRKL